jgi:hypothetical protein
MSEELCFRCGRCCFRKIRGNPKNLSKCPYLLIHENGLTSCKAWEKRKRLLAQGKKLYIGLGRSCGNRADSKYDFEGCPYNCPDGSKPILKIEVK